MFGWLNNLSVCGYLDMHIKAKPSGIVKTFGAWCHSISQAFNWQGIASKRNQKRARNRDHFERRYRNKSFSLSRYAIEYFIITILRVYIEFDGACLLLLSDITLPRTLLLLFLMQAINDSCQMMFGTLRYCTQFT